MAPINLPQEVVIPAKSFTEGFIVKISITSGITKNSDGMSVSGDDSSVEFFLVPMNPDTHEVDESKTKRMEIKSVMARVQASPKGLMAQAYGAIVAALNEEIALQASEEIAAAEAAAQAVLAAQDAAVDKAEASAAEAAAVAAADALAAEAEASQPG